MKPQITIRAQAAAVELSATNLRGSIDVLRRLVEQGKREDHELKIKQARLPDLQAAAETLRRLADRERAIAKAGEGLD